MDRRKEQSLQLWQRFAETGEIGAYLLYRAMRSAEQAEPPEKDRG